MSVESGKRSNRRHSSHAPLQNGNKAQRRACSLHEDLAQLLAALRLHLSSFKSESSAGSQLAPQIEEMDKLVGEAFTLLRSIAIEIYPMGPESDGLFSALRSLIRSLSERHDIDYKLIADESELEMGNTTGMAIFRIVQNALERISKLMLADEVLIKLRRREDKLLLSIHHGGQREPLDTREGNSDEALHRLRKQVRELGGKLRVITLERGERMEFTLPLNSSAAH